MLSALVSDNTKAADVYAGLKIPIYQGEAKDRDGDGVIDKLDACPKEVGPEENNGCPWGDADADGVLDNEDKCPNEAGPTENGGCPWGDSDNDGILDNEDACPNIAGPLENKGCPWGDADNDTVLDNVDQCPDVAGTVENNGCPAPAPKVTEAVLNTLSAYAKTILFNNGKSTLKDASKAVLDNIVEVLQEYPDAHFTINGYTDSSGSEALNQRLSEDRASTVMTYLIENGVSSSRLSHKGYGESNPIDDNSTAAGRRNNRRVEVVLVKQ
ncbi:OmpA family protein [Pseudotamlana haliotis]|uniref:OmpA family protein n=1 Tax=Pseudotamlana haliotis TaxID=2614804 RepID=UPI001CDA1816|nr:OmpA family protein [Tamlana haliotis]